MAMGDTGSSPSDWAQLYHRSLGQAPAHHHPSLGPGAAGFGAQAESTVVTTTSSSSTVTGSSAAAAAAVAGIEGRVGKSARRRSRASRRAPTTLLNTDTSNFRAMVQQFTGVPSGPYSSGGVGGGGAGAGGGAPIINFGLRSGDPRRQAAAAAMLSGHLQQYPYHQGQPYQQQQQHQQAAAAHHGGMMFSLGNSSGAISTTNSGGDVFLPGFSNSSGANLELPDGFFLDGVSGQMMTRPAPSNSGTDGYFT